MAKLQDGVHSGEANVMDQLLHYTQSLDKERRGRRMLHIQLSRLKPQNRGPNQRRIAADSFEKLIGKYEGRVFELPNGDIMVATNGANVADIEPTVTRLRYLFSEDPLFFGADTTDTNRFCTWYDLATEFRALMSRITQLHRGLADMKPEAQAQQPGQPLEAKPGQPAVAAAQMKPIEPRHLKEIEDALAQADVSNLIRRQSICLTGADNSLRPVFSELFVAVGELNRILMAEVDMTANRWLFQYLTGLLDQRMMAFLLKTQDQVYTRSFSLNINVQTLLSPVFKQFDQKIRPEAKRTIMFELQAVDIYHDMGAFVFARDSLQELGYRFCLDGLNHLTLPLVDRRALNMDLLKLYWNTEMLDDQSGKLKQQLAELIAQTTASRVILARCDTPNAVAFGRQLGISLFQGRYLDKVLAGETTLGAA